MSRCSRFPLPASQFRFALFPFRISQPETGDGEPGTARKRGGRALALAATAILLAAPGAARGASPSRALPHPKFEIQSVWQNLSYPTALAFESDRRLFFIERYTGRVRLIERGILRPDPVATLEVAAGGERGLLGLALHPDFGANRLLYVYYTSPTPLRNRVARLREGDGRAEEARVILDGLPAAATHNGGGLAFGPDGKLYVGVGDADDPGAPQDPGLPPGKILRVNPNGSVPADSRQPGSPVYAVGVRNATGLAFHPLTGRLFAAESGADRGEEAIFLRPGGGSGWPKAAGAGRDIRVVDAVLSYRSGAGPTSMAFYTGLRYPPAFRFNLYVGESASGWIRRVVLRYPDYTQVARDAVLVQAPGPVLDLSEGTDGYLYFSTPTGIYRIIYTGT